MQIFVKLDSGTITLNVEGDDTIETIKQKIYDKEGTPPQRQQICKGAHILHDTHLTLVDYNIQKEQTISMRYNPPPPVILEEGDLMLSRFNLAERVGESGDVFKCQFADPKSDVPDMALKFIRCNTDEERNDVLKIYYSILSDRHSKSPHLCDFLDAFLADRGHNQIDVAILMPIYTGTVQDLIRGGFGYFTDTVIADVANTVLNALHYLHSPKIARVHRDIKPTNIFYIPVGHEEANFFALGDLESSKNLANRTHATGGTGTFAYMAPETLLEYESTYKTDVWALGVVMYQLIMKQVHVKPMHVKSHQPDFAAKIKADLSGSVFCEMVCGMLISDPAQRLSVEDAMHELQKLHEKHDKKLVPSFCRCSSPQAHHFTRVPNKYYEAKLAELT